MLVLSRKVDEKIYIGDNIIVQVVAVKGDRVQIGIQAPKDIPIHREEVYQKLIALAKSESQSANQSVNQSAGSVNQNSGKNDALPNVETAI